jgi:hypothetical protein
MILVLILTILASGVADAAAQTTRAGELHARRESKARELQRIKRNRIEGALHKIENDLVFERLLNPPRGVHLRLGGIGEGAGFGAGPGFRYQTGAFDFRASAAASMKRYVIAESSLLVPGVVRDGAFAELYARRRDFPQEDFFGLGADSRVQDRSDFALRDTFVRATGGVRAGGFSAGIGGGYLAPAVGSGTDRRMPSVETIFSRSDLPGFDERPSFAVIEPFVEFSSADPPLNPTSGGRYRFTYRRFHDRDLARFSFDRWDLDARQYVPLLHGTRTVALRALISSSDADSRNVVPFYLLPTLGGSYSLRGFRSFRFRDRSLLLLQSEYRWRVNDFVHGAVFYETGAVGPELSDLGAFRRDYGVGLRAGSRNGVAFRADVALGSGEGTRILIRFDNAF